MLIHCPSCNTEYDCEPGKYQCVCGAKILVEPDGDVFVASSGRTDSSDVTIAPRRMHSQSGIEVNDVTMPGKRDRKPDGRFEAGDLILGRYKVLSVLGRGGMGMVYECLDEVAGIKIALKTLPPELAQIELEMEDVKENFQLVSRLAHPNIAIYKQLERDNSTGNYYLIMECVEGEDLRRWIKRMRRENSLTLENVLPIIRQVASALDYAHGKRIIHRDIKPGNIMVDADGQVKVLDFGLAAQIHTSMTRVSMVSQGTGGTAPYMAPEQWRGKAQGAAADQYALAVMAYEMLAGRLPFDSADATVLREAVLNETPDPVPGITVQAQQALMRGMAKAPADRFGSCMEFAAALSGEEKAAVPKPEIKTAGPVDPAAPVAPAAPAPKKNKAPADKLVEVKSAPPDQNGTKRRIVTASLLILVVGLCLAGWFLTRSGATTASSEGAENTAGSGSPAQTQGAQTGPLPGDVSSQTSLPEAGTQQPVQIPTGNMTIDLPNGVNLNMMKVEAGTFTMSASDGENDDDEVPHRATLTKDFYIGRTEVTQAQWKAVMGSGSNPSEFKGDDLPVEKVSWNDAMEFCEKLNTTRKAPSGWKFTLPTETQWEFAARGGNKSKGYKYSGSNDIGEVAWYYENSGDNRLSDSSWDYNKLDSNHCKTHPVGQKKANELGLYDMSGNVWEWCLDDWQAKSDKLTAEFTRGNDRDGSARARRGGGWGNFARICRSAYRGFNAPGSRYFSIGFRVALIPESY